MADAPTSPAADDPCCCICQVEIDGKPSTLKCDHVFHFACIHTWVNLHNTCPICRGVVIPPAKRARTDTQDGDAQDDQDGLDVFNRMLNQVHATLIQRADPTPERNIRDDRVPTPEDRERWRDAEAALAAPDTATHVWVDQRGVPHVVDRLPTQREIDEALADIAAINAPRQVDDAPWVNINGTPQENDRRFRQDDYDHSTTRARIVRHDFPHVWQEVIFERLTMEERQARVIHLAAEAELARAPTIHWPPPLEDRVPPPAWVRPAQEQQAAPHPHGRQALVSQLMSVVSGPTPEDRERWRARNERAAHRAAQLEAAQLEAARQDQLAQTPYLQDLAAAHASIELARSRILFNSQEYQLLSNNRGMQSFRSYRSEHSVTGWLRSWRASTRIFPTGFKWRTDGAVPSSLRLVADAEQYDNLGPEKVVYFLGGRHDVFRA